MNAASVLDISFCLLNDAMNTSHLNTSTISNSSNTSSHHEGESILENKQIMNQALSHSVLEKMEMTDLVSLCKEYRNRVINQPTEENITILQDINTILDQKMKCTNTNQIPIITQQQENQEENQSKTATQQPKTQNETNQIDSTQTILSTEKIECSQDLSEDTIDFKLVLSSIQQNNQDQQVDLFDDTDDDDTINISPIFIKNANDLVIEEGESKPFQNEIFKSLEFKPMKIRRKQSLETNECSKRQHLSSE